MLNIFGEAKKWHEKYEREQEARVQAENLLETKATEIYLKNKDLEAKNLQLSETLEELQASEEELRQNIEELASSNEELSRTQILLINANKSLQDSEKIWNSGSKIELKTLKKPIALSPSF